MAAFSPVSGFDGAKPKVVSEDVRTMIRVLPQAQPGSDIEPVVHEASADYYVVALTWARPFELESQRPIHDLKIEPLAQVDASKTQAARGMLQHMDLGKGE